MMPADAESLVPSRQQASAVGALERLLRGRLLRKLAHLRGGRLALEDACGTATVGEVVAGGAALTVRFAVTDPRCYRLLAAQGSVGAGEAYARGWWHSDDLVGLVRLLVRNRALLDGMETGSARFGGWLLRVAHALQANTRHGSRRNVAAHYDLGNEFFALFLSGDLMYSSALWAGEEDTLELASERKLERICEKLQLRPNQRVLEIGSGWGGFALHAARHYGCHVTTTTISAEQYRLTAQRAAALGLTQRVSVLQQDYRDLRGAFDRVVSVEMIEAVGAQYLEGYFGQIGRLLRPDGLALLQAITIEDHRYIQALRSVDFIKRHIFPGSFIPSLAALLMAKTRACTLGLIHQEDFGLSYARTLRAWRQRFMAQLPQARAQGFDEQFLRAWEFYLAYCEGGFRERSVGVSQLLFAGPQWRPGPGSFGGWGARVDPGVPSLPEREESP
jgi:cyclopropane-fatty-acyl-phospholipid synthase